MLLAIDIGNSRIKTALFKNDKIVSHFSFIDPAELKSLISDIKEKDIAICSVVPEKTIVVLKIIKELTDKSLFMISKDIRTNVEIGYKTPDTLGVDRLCSAEGAYFLFNNLDGHKNYNDSTFILTIDFGTATTINVIEYPGKFIGGLIAPGFYLMFESLNKKTAQLPNVNFQDYNSVIGDSTKSSIASGVVSSVVGMIEKTTNYLMKEKSAEKIFIYLTGGNAKKIIPFLNFDFIFEEGLVLYGMNALMKINKY